MRTDHLLPHTFLTSTPPSSPRPPPPPARSSVRPSPPATTLAHLYGHVQAKSNTSSTGSGSMWRPEARPPLAHARSVHHHDHPAGTLHAELHAQYSMVAVVVLTALFFTITLFATGLLLAFCKKNNTVFSLQKGEQDSNYELDDLDKTESKDDDDDGGDDDSSPPRRHREKHRRSQTLPDLVGSGSDDRRQVASTDSSSSRRHLAKPPDRPGASSSQLTAGASSRRQAGEKNTQGESDAHTSSSSSVRRSVTVAAIHHHHSSPPPVSTVGDCCVTIHVEDLDTKSDMSDTAFDHLYLKLQEEEEEEEGKDDDNEESDVDDVQNDQTRALLRS